MCLRGRTGSVGVPWNQTWVACKPWAQLLSLGSSYLTLKPNSKICNYFTWTLYFIYQRFIFSFSQGPYNIRNISYVQGPTLSVVLRLIKMTVKFYAFGHFMLLQFSQKYVIRTGTVNIKFFTIVLGSFEYKINAINNSYFFKWYYFKVDKNGKCNNNTLVWFL